MNRFSIIDILKLGRRKIRSIEDLDHAETDVGVSGDSRNNLISVRRNQNKSTIFCVENEGQHGTQSDVYSVTSDAELAKKFWKRWTEKALNEDESSKKWIKPGEAREDLQTVSNTDGDGFQDNKNKAGSDYQSVTCDNNASLKDSVRNECHRELPISGGRVMVGNYHVGSNWMEDVTPGGPSSYMKAHSACHQRVRHTVKSYKNPGRAQSAVIRGRMIKKTDPCRIQRATHLFSSKKRVLNTYNIGVQLNIDNPGDSRRGNESAEEGIYHDALSGDAKNCGTGLNGMCKVSSGEEPLATDLAQWNQPVGQLRLLSSSNGNHRSEFI